MNVFEEYLDKVGYSWNDFDRPYEMQNLIEQFANEKVSQALSLHNVSQQRELLKDFLQYVNCSGTDSKVLFDLLDKYVNNL